jgi:hypothetical protein
VAFAGLINNAAFIEELSHEKSWDDLRGVDSSRGSRVCANGNA